METQGHLIGRKRRRLHFIRQKPIEQEEDNGMEQSEELEEEEEGKLNAK